MEPSYHILELRSIDVTSQHTNNEHTNLTVFDRFLLEAKIIGKVPLLTGICEWIFLE